LADSPHARELVSLTTPKLTRYIRQSPTPKQIAYLLLSHFRKGLYGGAAGGGKSSALLMEALQFVDVPRYSALILRRTFPDLSQPGGIMSRAQEWLSGTDAKWNDRDHEWLFPYSNARLKFGHLDNKDAHLKYQGGEYQYIAFDEATQIPYYQIQYLYSRNRRPSKGTNRMISIALAKVPLRFRLASNPGGVSHADIKTHYVDRDTRDPGTFYLPALLDDNPHLDTVEYHKTLEELDAVTRAQLRYGDWEIKTAGRMFDRGWFEIVDEPPAPDKIARTVRYWDMAATEPARRGHDPDWTTGVKMSLAKDGTIYIEHVVRLRKRPGETDIVMRTTADMDGRHVPIVEEQEPGSSGVAVCDAHRRMLAGWIYSSDKKSVKKAERAKPFASYAESGNVRLVRGTWMRDYLDEIEIFPDGPHDDQVDASSGAFHYLTGGTRPRVRVI